MKSLNVALASLGVAVSCAFLSTALAQQARVIEERLVIKDPTVAAAGKSLIGGSLEGVYTYAPYRLQGFDQTQKGTIRGTKPGINLFFGYSDFSLNYAYRQGTEKIKGLSHTATAADPFNYSHEISGKSKDNEITVRWRVRALDFEYLAPYVYLGYVNVDWNSTDTITTGGIVFVSSGTNQRVRAQTFKSWMGGVGGIIPVTEKFGFRADGGVTSTRATSRLTNSLAAATTVSGSGTGGRFTGTMYYNLAEGWSVQAGGRYEVHNGGNAGWYGRGGFFGMLTFTHRF